MRGPAAEAPGSGALVPEAALSERELSLLWEGQTFPPEALATAEGHRLRVIYRGRRSPGPGPDFRDAIIAGPWGLLQGDVELHVRSGDFRRHGHQRDPAYAGVVLHVVFWDDDGGETELPGGGRAPVVALAQWAEGRARELRAWLEGPAFWREPCYGAVGRLGGDGAGAILDRLGEMRFRQKAFPFSRRLAAEGADQLLWEGLLEALGYGGDREAFRALAARAPWSALAGVIGPLPQAARAGAALAMLREAAGPGLEAGGQRLRPGNRPGRRLAGAAELAARMAPSGPAAVLASLLLGPAGGYRALTAALTVAGCIGPARAQEALANAVLPCLWAAGGQPLRSAAESAYGRLPLPARYGAVRHLHSALAGVRVGARRQQGMLYLLRQYCSRGGCGRCPLS